MEKAYYIEEMISDFTKKLTLEEIKELARQLSDGLSVYHEMVGDLLPKSNIKDDRDETIEELKSFISLLGLRYGFFCPNIKNKTIEIYENFCGRESNITINL